jgi:8-oxo-dGTP diphosphatase
MIRKRVAAIIINNNALLLMHRKKNNHEYWVFCGGGVEDNEDLESALIREIKEETTIDITVDKLFCQMDEFEMDQYFFICSYLSGNPKLEIHSEEYQRMHKDNWYNPEWIPLNQIPNLTIYPNSIKEKLLNYLKS